MGLNSIVAAKQHKALDALAVKAAPYAGKTAAAPPSSALAALDTKGISGLDRSAVKQVARFNADIAARYPDLLKLKYSAMSESPFSFLRGSDHLMYQDLRRIEGPAMDAGPRTLLQGDMHLANFGSMARPDGKLFLALNDFDEAYVGPAKLDLKRLATSVVLAGKQAGFSPDQTRQFVSDFAQSYHGTLAAQVTEPRTVGSIPQPKIVRKVLEAAQKVKPQDWLATKTQTKGGKLAFKHSPSAMPVPGKIASDVQSAFDRYRAKLPKPSARELAGYKVSDVASVVEGTGSVGRARYHLLLTADHKPPMILEMKEEVPAAMSPYVKTPNVFGQQANRDLLASYAMDGKLDPFFGKVKLPRRDALESSSFLVRQVDPTKTGIDPTTVRDAGQFSDLVKYYGQEVAISHSAGDKAGLSGPKDLLASLGPQADFTSELVNFGQRYAQQVERDFSSFKAALVKDPLLLKAMR